MYVPTIFLRKGFKTDLSTVTEVEFDRAVTDVGEVGRIGEGMIGESPKLGTAE